MEMLYMVINGVLVFGNNSTESVGWNLEHCEYTVGGWPWQILGAICAALTVWEAAEILFCFFCQVNDTQFRRFSVGNISLNVNRTTSISDAMSTFGTEFW